MNKNNTILAMLLALAAASAGAQTTGATQGQPATGETYRPSLDGQQTSTPAAPIDMQPKTQEEKATGRQEPSRLKDIDPATHPAPQNVRPQPTPAPKTQQEQGVQPVARGRQPAASGRRSPRVCLSVGGRDAFLLFWKRWNWYW